MRVFVLIVLFAWLLAGCQGGMKAISANNEEHIKLFYQDDGVTRAIHGSSTSGESFSGKLLWTSSLGGSGHYRGILVGDTGRTLQIGLGCNTHRQVCSGTARDNNGLAYYVFSSKSVL